MPTETPAAANQRLTRGEPNAVSDRRSIRCARGRPPPAHELTGIIHCHSTYSDGTGTVPEIAAAARANDLDFLLLTDHDTLAAAQHGEEGWHGSVLLLVGCEVSPYRRNHYLAFGLSEPIDHKELTPAQIVASVNNAGGFGFPAHPFSKGSERFSRLGEGMP